MQKKKTLSRKSRKLQKSAVKISQERIFSFYSFIAQHSFTQLDRKQLSTCLLTTIPGLKKTKVPNLQLRNKKHLLRLLLKIASRRFKRVLFRKLSARTLKSLQKKTLKFLSNNKMTIWTKTLLKFP